MFSHKQQVLQMKWQNTLFVIFVTFSDTPTDGILLPSKVHMTILKNPFTWLLTDLPLLQLAALIGIFRTMNQMAMGM